MFKERRRKRLQSAPFPPEWSRIIQARFALFDRLPEPDQRELEKHIQVFLGEKHFEGCAGLVLTDEIKLTIAAQACLLLLHRDMDYYPGLQSILVYPSTYFANTTRHREAGVLEETRHSRLGEAWHSGAVVLAWDAVRNGAANPEDGHNVVLHEFAHQLDFEDGSADGAPLLGGDGPFWKRPAKYITWAKVLSEEFKQLQATVESQKHSILDAYGATNAAEFFAVATEFFFEKPHALQQKHPELYAELKSFYKQDPVHWSAPAPRPHD